MSAKAKVVLAVFISLVLIFPLYIFLHETGHALVAIGCGAKITRFSIASARISYEGG